MQPIPEAFARTTIELHGEQGAQWLKELPTLLATYAQRWSLTVLPPFTNLSYNYVAPAVRADGSAVVLKAAVPNRELATEAAALRHYDGVGIARLLEFDPAGGVLLIERLHPGSMLFELEDDEQATAIAAGVMRTLWRPPPAVHSFPLVTDWADGLQRLRAHFGGGTGPFPAALVARAEQLFAELIASQGPPMLLHGDLHHYNILRAERASWLAIDPKGLVGEAEYELGALLRNPATRGPATSPIDLLARRVDQLAAALGFDHQRILAWCLAQAVLSAWWTFEDHGHDWEPTIAYAERVAALVR